jgi:transcriptional regulator with XRE-family HTH domain
VKSTQLKNSPTHSFLERLNLVLKLRGLKRGDLAKDLGVAPSTLTRWNHGAEPRFGIIADIARITSVRREWLAAGVGEMCEETAQAGDRSGQICITEGKGEKTPETNLAPEAEVPEITKDPAATSIAAAIEAMISPAEAGALRALDLAKLMQAVPNANTGILLGAMWTGVGDVLAWRLSFDNQITDKLQVILTELARRAPAAIGYTRPIEPTPKPAKP